MKSAYSSAATSYFHWRGNLVAGVDQSTRRSRVTQLERTCRSGSSAWLRLCMLCTSAAGEGLARGGAC